MHTATAHRTHAIATKCCTLHAIAKSCGTRALRARKLHLRAVVVAKTANTLTLARHQRSDVNGTRVLHTVWSCAQLEGTGSRQARLSRSTDSRTASTCSVLGRCQPRGSTVQHQIVHIRASSAKLAQARPGVAPSRADGLLKDWSTEPEAAAARCASALLKRRLRLPQWQPCSLLDCSEARPRANAVVIPAANLQKQNPHRRRPRGRVLCLAPARLS